MRRVINKITRIVDGNRNVSEGVDKIEATYEACYKELYVPEVMPDVDFSEF